jgi:hypothetical protein
MVKDWRRWRHWRIWLAAPAAVALTVLGLTVPAQAQPGPAARTTTPPARTTTAATTTRSLRSLDEERPPPGSVRWVVSDPVAYRQAVRTGNWVYTPYGLSDKACVYHAPNHALVQNNEIVAPSGAVQRMTPCTHPILLYPASPERHSAPPASPEGNPTARTTENVAPDSGPCAFGPGGDYWAASCNGSAPEWITTFDQKYAVPSDPAKDGALIFLWGGLEDANGDTLLQDVLTWGANGSIVTNPNIWYVTPWYLWPGNHSVIGASIHVEPVDTIDANLTASKCSSGGACTWVLHSADVNSGGSTSLTVGSDATFDLLLGSVMEVPSADGCVETPTGGHAAFRNLTVTGNDGTYSPDFGTSTPDPQCSVSITQSATAADILWKP